MENELDLEKLFLPAWATETTSANRFANYTGDEEVRQQGRRGDRRGGAGRPGDRRGGDRPDDRRGPRREGGPPQGQGQRPGQGPRPGQGGPRPPGQNRPPRREDDRQGRPFPRQGDHWREREERQPEIPLPEVQAAIIIDDKGADSLARQIRVTGRAYPMFDIAAMILQRPERYQVSFSVIKKAEGQVAQPLFVCALDGTLWLSEDEVVDYVLDRHFNMFYQAERTATPPPKGVYTFVAQCGISGVVLGPPNYHGYQEQLRRLHAERFSRMPFEVYKSRVKIVRDEATVKKWIEDQSWKTEYICLNVPDAPRLGSREAVALHFRETHMANIVQQTESHTVGGVLARNLRSTGLQRLVRKTVDEQRRFPLRLVTNLSQQFSARGLQFFKRDKSVTYVSVARPHYLDFETSVVSEGVRKIIEFINSTPRCTRLKLMGALAPALVVPAPAPAPAAAPAVPAVSVEGEATPAAALATESAAEPAATPEAPAPAAPAQPEPSPEQMAVISDLHWLIHQGHVIEFANGLMETAKKPVPKPPKPEPKPAPAVVNAAPAVENSTQPPAESQPAVEAPAPVAVAEPIPAEPAVQEALPASEPPAPTAEEPSNQPQALPGI